jgi:hypothetical protein
MRSRTDGQREDVDGGAFFFSSAAGRIDAT